jgi:hypothetical protein
MWPSDKEVSVSRDARYSRALSTIDRDRIGPPANEWRFKLLFFHGELPLDSHMFPAEWRVAFLWCPVVAYGDAPY